MVVETIQIETLRNHAPGAFSFRLPSETSTLWAHFSLFAGFFLDRVCQENNRHGREFIGAMKPRRVLYESQ